jgi:hypothetical protein
MMLPRINPGQAVALFGRFAVPNRHLPEIRRPAVPQPIGHGEHPLRRRIAGLGGDPEMLRGFGSVPRLAGFAVPQHRANHQLPGHISMLSRAAIPCRGLGAVRLGTQAGEQRGAQIDPGVGVALGCRQPVPADGLGIVVGDALFRVVGGAFDQEKGLGLVLGQAQPAR